MGRRPLRANRASTALTFAAPLRPGAMSPPALETLWQAEGGPNPAETGR